MTLFALEVQPSSRNVSLRLSHWAREAPSRLAVQSIGDGALTYEALELKVDALAHGLTDLGLARGDRASIFVKPGAELVALVHACFRTGVVPVLIDPGMGRRELLGCIERMAPRALIGVPKAHVARLLFPRAFRSVEINVTVGKRLAQRWTRSGSSLADLEQTGAQRGSFCPRSIAPDEEAAILFTSGSTGPPKGVIYTHANLAAQLDSLAKLYTLEPGEVDCACFPLFALFDHALGMTSLFPRIDPTRPGHSDPAQVFAAIEQNRATFTFGSPAIWRRVVPWMRERKLSFTSLRRVTIAGAPVPPRLVLGVRRLLPGGGEVHTPYGATEALPVSNVTGAEIAELRSRIEGGEGTCVGLPVDGIEIALVRVTDEPLAAFSEELRVSPGKPGEICVRGSQVTREYKFDDLATRLAKIRGAPRPPSISAESTSASPIPAHGERFWHRMGDVGRFDADGRLWLLGRKSERIETSAGTLFPVPLENVYDTVRGVRRSALIGLGPRGSERVALVIEPERGADRQILERILKSHRRDLVDTARVERILFHPAFPVDVRHNAKILRPRLGIWARKAGP